MYFIQRTLALHYHMIELSRIMLSRIKSCQHRKKKTEVEQEQFLKHSIQHPMYFVAKRGTKNFKWLRDFVYYIYISAIFLVCSACMR